jgi:hypothetical protein
MEPFNGRLRSISRPRGEAMAMAGAGRGADISVNWRIDGDGLGVGGADEPSSAPGRLEAGAS